MPIILLLWTNTLLFLFMMSLLFALWSIIICYMKTGVYLKWTLWEKNESPLLTFEIEPTRYWTSWDNKWEEDEQAENNEPDTKSDTDEDIVIEEAAAKQLTNAIHTSLSLQEQVCRLPATPSFLSLLQSSIIDPTNVMPSSPTSTLAEPGWGERE